jgi:type IV pilus assembly protein PilQ
MSKIKVLRSCLAWLLVLGLLTPSLAAAKEMSNLSLAKGKVFLNLKDAEVKSVLQIFAKATGVNIVASDDVKGKVTVTFSGIDPKDGLEAVLRTKGLDWFEDHGTIFVSTKKIMRTFYLANAKPTDLKATLTAILPVESVVTADDAYNVLVIQTSSDYLPRVEKLIQELDVPPVQVMVEVKLIQITNGLEGNVGVDATYRRGSNPNNYVQTYGQATQKTNPDGTINTTAQGLFAHVLSIFSAASFEAYVSALATNNKVDVVASPRLTTLNNKEASLLIGSKLPYKTDVVGQTSTTQVVNFLNVGTNLLLTPTVTKNGYIRMRVAPKVSEGSLINGLPFEDTTETLNEVMVKDGQTFVIGGLVKEKDIQTDYGVPFLMDIPVLGQLFRKSVTSREKNELLVFVTPHIITPEYLDVLNKPIEDMVKRADDSKAQIVH